MKEQKQTVAKLMLLDQAQALHEITGKELQALVKAILDRAFRGEL
jgi:hypothetical protein